MIELTTRTGVSPDDPEEQPMNEIIVGVDRSDTARRAALTAARLAVTLSKPLHLVMAVSRTKPISGGSGDDTFHTDWLTSAEEFLDVLSGELPAKRITRTISLSDPATALCDEAQRLQATMIVVGNRRVQGLTRVLGAVATDVARQAPCDVLVANTTDDPED
jgi:nucleotide-binding universal stress UspA family protein